MNNVTVIIRSNDIVNETLLSNEYKSAFILRFLAPVIMFLKFVKILFILRVFPSFGQLVDLINTCFVDIWKFLVLYNVWVFFFATLYSLLGVKDEFDEVEGSF